MKMDGTTEIATKKDEKSITIKTDRPATPLDIVNHAMQSGREISLDQIEKLYELQERHEKNEARKAFNKAMADFKADPPDLVKACKVDFTTNKGRTNYNYANIGDIAPIINKALSNHGLIATWETTQENGISVTCIIKHNAGHSEKTTLTAPSDQTGNKNAIQAIGSTVSYLQRYTLLSITGLAVREDDDGQAACENTITEKQHSEIVDMMNAKNIVEADFLVWLNGQKGTSISDMAELPSHMYGFVVSTIKSVRV